MKKISKSIVATFATVAFTAMFALCGCKTDKIEATPADEIVTTIETTITTEETTTTTSVTTSITTTEVTTTVEETTEETTIDSEEPTTESPVEQIASSVSTYIETEAPKPVEPEYVVYKSSTHYIHRSTCHWASSGELVRIENTEGIEARKCTECNPDMEVINEYVEPEPEAPTSDGLTYFGYFGRVTYYPATAYYDGVCGGSGRTLLGYGNYDNGIRGSIASRSLYETYGYNRNGRTTVYLEFPNYPEMNGNYYVDDCCADYGVIDIFVWSGYSCPFYSAGVITANCYI